jgi:hypothetical protein
MLRECYRTAIVRESVLYANRELTNHAPPYPLTI